jgi:hypothetical protein
MLHNSEHPLEFYSSRFFSLCHIFPENVLIFTLYLCFLIYVIPLESKFINFLDYFILCHYFISICVVL